MSFTIDIQGRRLPVSRWGHISASQLKTAGMCLRKWAFEKVWGVKSPSAYHHAYGKDLHEVGERYFGMQVSDWEALFPSWWARHLLPADRRNIQALARMAVERGVWRARPGAIVEHPIALLVGRRMVDARGMPLVARATTFENDLKVRSVSRLLAMDDGSPLPAGWDDLPPLVGFIDVFDLWAEGLDPLVEDHKTAKNTRYVLTAQELTKDVQMLSYAAAALGLRPASGRVRLRHNVFIKDPQALDVFATEAVVTADDVRVHWAQVIALSEHMQVVRTQVRDQPLDPKKPEERADAWHRVPGAIDDEGGYERACKAYGGCPFQDVCKRRCSAAQVVTRLDTAVRAAVLLPATVPSRSTFKLNINHPDPSTPRRMHAVS
jgi:hypothetical protein